MRTRCSASRRQANRSPRSPLLTLVADGTVAIDDPVNDLLPELAAPRVLRDIKGPIDDTVAGRAVDHGGRSAALDERARLPVRLLGAGRSVLVERLHQGPPRP